MAESQRTRLDRSLPLPVSITLYNRFPPVLDGEENGDLPAAVPAPKKKLFRPDYTMNLLVSVRLEIYHKKSGKDERILYAYQVNQSSIHPVWDHLNERVEDWQRGSKNTWEEHAESTYARIMLVEGSNQTVTVVVNALPLHPKMLRRIPKAKDHNTSSRQQQPPPRLPTNAVLIQYTDGSDRVSGALYYILVERGVISEYDPQDALSFFQDNSQGEERRSRFEDDTFNVLDTVISADGVPTPRQSLLETDNELLATPVRSLEEEDYDDFKGLPMPLLIDTVSEQKVLQEDLIKERQILLAKIAAEEALLQTEEEELRMQGDCLRKTMNAISVIREETDKIHSATQTFLLGAPDLSFKIALHQRKLVKELQQIYPITTKHGTELRFWIAGAELTEDLFRGQVHEDEISAALGFLAHSVVLLSKFLNVPLRHRIVCNSSRSAIQDSDGTILPLFLSRVAERPQLERGLLLMHRDVDCLGQSRGILRTDGDEDQLPRSHILVKVKDLYDRVIHGTLP